MELWDMETRFKKKSKSRMKKEELRLFDVFMLLLLNLYVWKCDAFAAQKFTYKL